jgi:DoxX-like family
MVAALQPREQVERDMQSGFQTTTDKAMLWTGRAMSGLVLLFLVMDGITKLVMIQPVIDATTQLGFPLGLIRPIGIIVIACAALYAVPRTALLGAILTTGLLGGTIASKIRLEEPLFSQALFGLYVGVLLWGGLYLRDGRLRTLLPLRSVFPAN